MNSFTAFHPKDARVRKVWDKDDILNNSTSFVLHIDLDNVTTVSLHALRAELEVIYKTLDDFFTEIHKAERAEVEAERYAEVMFDQMLSGQESLS